MNIEQIATQFTDRPHAEPGDVAIDHPYRARWWLPIRREHHRGSFRCTSADC